eukprot:4768489-Pyramimonas_sp.AAC.2
MNEPFTAQVVGTVLCAGLTPLGTPVLKIAHRWGAGFPGKALAVGDDEFLADESLRMYACGDFCKPSESKHGYV